MDDAERELGDGARWAYERFMRPSVLALSVTLTRIDAARGGKGGSHGNQG
jgi:hypothetical protein